MRNEKKKRGCSVEKHILCAFTVLLYVSRLLYQVTIKGDIEATGTSYVPTKAYMFIHVTQVSFNENLSFTAVANQPEAKAADENGSSRDVSGLGNLNVISSPSKALPKADAVSKLAVMGETNVVHVETHSAKLEVVPAYEK